MTKGNPILGGWAIHPLQNARSNGSNAEGARRLADEIQTAPVVPWSRLRAWLDAGPSRPPAACLYSTRSASVATSRDALHAE